MTNITLPSRCDRSAAEELYPKLSKAVGEGPVTVETAEAKHMGMAMLQLLVSARKSGDVTINRCELMDEVAHRAGLDTQLFGGEG